MKHTLLTLLALLWLWPAAADEGMWLPSLISERIDDMRAKGFRLTAEDIYSINRASMKDAVVLFGGGCTGELVSAEGLLLTNHHCGYDAIQRHSTVEHDYLTHGFWARSRAEELPNKGLNVRFLVRMEEVTDRIAAGESPAEIIARAEAEGIGYKAAIEQMYYGDQQFLFIYEQFDDVRLVAAPPSSIGKFGGDTDNWIWPRHTGDFSIFRIYASKDNKPAAYSPENVPYRPKKHFTISTRGFREGDFTMIYGFPGNTQEYILSDAAAYIAERSDPAKIAIRDGRLDIITRAQESDPALRIHYAAKHASIANAWKKWQGEVLGLNRMKTIAAKQEQEQAFARENPRGAELLREMKAEYARITTPYFAREITLETLRALPAKYSAEERAETVFPARPSVRCPRNTRPRSAPKPYSRPGGRPSDRCSAGSSGSMPGVVRQSTRFRHSSTVWPQTARPKPSPRRCSRRCGPVAKRPSPTRCEAVRSGCSTTSHGCWGQTGCATSRANGSTHSTGSMSMNCGGRGPNILTIPMRI